MLSISLRGLLAFGSTATAKFKGILSCCRIASAIGVNWGSGESFFFSENTGLGMLVATILTEAPSGGSSTERSWSNSARRQWDPLPLNLKVLDLFYGVFS